MKSIPSSAIDLNGIQSRNWQVWMKPTEAWAWEDTADEKPTAEAFTVIISK